MDNSGGNQTNVQGSNVQASLGGRYASALFELAVERKALAGVEASLADLKATHAASPELRGLVANPLLSRAQSGQAIDAVAAKLGTDPLTRNFLGVLAANRRLGDLPAMIRAFETLAANHRGEVSAHVTSAHALDDSQIAALKAKLKARVGREVAVSTQVDPAILGGLVVKIGSAMIDSSIRTRLNTLAHAMKG